MANTSTLITRRDYGMKIAMPGFDLRIATDNQLLFNSSFPILQIKILAGLGIITRNPSGSPDEDELNSPTLGGELVTIYDTGSFSIFVYRWYHGLGYPPFYLPVGANGVTYGSLGWSVDENYVYYIATFPPTIGWNGDRNGVVDFILLCPIDITKDIEYPYTALPLDTEYGKIGDYGFKSVEFGDINQNDFDNLGIDPRLQSQMIMAVKTLDTLIPGDTAIEYTLPSGMTTDDVVVYGFQKGSITVGSITLTTWSHLYKYGQAPPSIFVEPANNKVKIVLSGSETGVSMVLTRTPMVAPSIVEMTL